MRPAEGAIFLNGGSSFVAAGVNFTGNEADVYGGESFVVNSLCHAVTDGAPISHLLERFSKPE